MKKSVITVILCLVLLLTACGNTAGNNANSGAASAENGTQEENHVHVPGPLTADLNDHYYTCQCGEEIRSAHTFDEFEICTQCNSAVYLNEDSSYSIYAYDEQGALVNMSDYDANGELLYQQYTEYEYYEDGNPHIVREYVNDVRTSESTYSPCANPDDGVYLETCIFYYEDGSTETITYDEAFNVLSVVGTDDMGQLFYEENYEYEYDANGNCIRQTAYVDGKIEWVYTYTYDAEGNSLGSLEQYYDDDGQISDEYSYDAEGNELIDGEPVESEE